LQDGDFADAVIDEFAAQCFHQWKDKTTYFPGVAVVKRIYCNTPESSPARRFLVDVYAYEGKSHWLSKEYYLPEEFLNDLAIRMVKAYNEKSPLKDPTTMSTTCGYHQHGRDVLCYRKRRHNGVGIAMENRNSTSWAWNSTPQGSLI
jgi:hypothetical protein